MSNFYESKSITKTMKECLDALRKMYPREKDYEGILLSVLLEFEHLFYNKHTKFSRQIINKYNEKRIDLQGKKLPDSIDWADKKVEYND